MPTAAPTPNRAAPVRVAECRRCGQLFAVYATEGDVACPACDATTNVAALEIVELGVAAPVEVKVEVKIEAPEPAPAPIELAAAPAEHEYVEPVRVEAPAAPAIAEPLSRPPTVAEWLLQSEQSAPRATVERAGEAKRSLAESLGWAPGTFDVESLATPRDEAAADPAESYDDTRHDAATFADSLKDFRFDYGATPLSEQLEAEADECVSLELSGHAADAPQPLRLDALAAPTPQKRGWGNFIGMAVGLMLVAGPAAYFAVTWESGDPVAELASRDGELFTEDAPIDSEPEAPAANAFASDASAPKSSATADPFIDSSTKPASFDNGPASFDKGSADEPAFDLPPSAPKEVTRSAAAQVAADEPIIRTPEADPYAAKPQAAPALATTPLPIEDRYATTATPAEPAAFAPPEEATVAAPEEQVNSISEKVDGMVEPVAAFAEPKPFEMAAPTKEVGLVNAPKYGARELAEAFAPAEAAAVGFATGSLDDPEQVSTMGQHYAHLCHLAQVVTLLDASDPSLMTAELQAADTFKRLLRDDRSRGQSRQIAGPWIAWTGRPHGGVFFAGMPEDLRRAGEVIQYEFRIGESIVPVVMSEPIDPNRFAQTGAAEVGVIGVVVENPRQWIAGYEGDAERVVWVRKTLALPPPEKL
jgi:uncharacterized Zn finger protein (UPF0148 family)